VHDAEQRRQRRAGDDAKQYRDVTDEALKKRSIARMTKSTKSATPRPSSWP